jgi:hypothetical protein
MRAIETGQQREHAPDLHFFEQERLVCRPFVTPCGEIGQTIRKVLREPLKGQAPAFDAALSGRNEVVRGDAVHPGEKATLTPERAQVGDHAHEDLLRRVSRVLRMPEHPKRQVVDGPLNLNDHMLLKGVHTKTDLHGTVRRGHRGFPVVSGLERVSPFRECDLDAAASRFDPGPGRTRDTRTYKIDRDRIHLTGTVVHADGRVENIQFDAVLDGKDYAATGNPRVETIAQVRVDAYTVKTTTKRDGRVTATSTRQVWKDGRTMTIHSTGTDEKGASFDNTLVFRKRETL